MTLEAGETDRDAKVETLSSEGPDLPFGQIKLCQNRENSFETTHFGHLHIVSLRRSSP
jgi:hypothetical protein